MRIIWLTLAVMGLSLPALVAPVSAAPAPLIDNERVTVWDITLAKGDASPVTPPDEDSVIMFLEGGTIRTLLANGKSHVATRKFGDAVFLAKGSGASDTLVSGGPAHEIIVALKNQTEPVVPNNSGLPAAFPRPGSVKVLENPRVIVWHYSWVPGKPTPMHFHDKDVVVAYRYDGTLKSVMPDGSVTENPYKRGEIRFNKANRTHSELLATARQSAVILELK
jgi:redox-sensitive bicupin YhaK (pirin superfamily)